jgi:hypothetical protein
MSVSQDVGIRRRSSLSVVGGVTQCWRVTTLELHRSAGYGGITIRPASVSGREAVANPETVTCDTRRLTIQWLGGTISELASVHTASRCSHVCRRSVFSKLFKSAGVHSGRIGARRHSTGLRIDRLGPIPVFPWYLCVSLLTFDKGPFPARIPCFQGKRPKKRVRRTRFAMLRSRVRLPSPPPETGTAHMPVFLLRQSDGREVVIWAPNHYPRSGKGHETSALLRELVARRSFFSVVLD